jgi:manganese transport protein
MRRFGPGLLVTAAFIGPGTVTTASVAGGRFGFALLWALIFSIIATIVLQEMAARLGLVSGEGLAEALRTTFRSRVLAVLSAGLVVAAIAAGNAAFQTGNIMGAAMGMEMLTGMSRQIWVLAVGAGAIIMLGLGAYRAIERLLVGLVMVMSIVFVVCMFVVRPNPLDMLSGMLVPRVPSGSLVTVIALIGTTVVPYNLFLHASSVREKWPATVPTAQALKESRLDTIVSISIGGLITLAIMTTAATAFFAEGKELRSAATMAEQLEPLLGPAAKYFFATGFMAAGVTSAITAPLAAAYATAGALGWKRDLRDRRFRAVWLVIVIVGAGFAFVGERPVAAIIFAQAANGILLPVAAVFLLVVMNRGDLLREYKNGLLANILGAVVVLIAAGLGLFQIMKVIGVVTP